MTGHGEAMLTKKEEVGDQTLELVIQYRGSSWAGLTRNEHSYPFPFAKNDILVVGGLLNMPVGIDVHPTQRPPHRTSY